MGGRLDQVLPYAQRYSLRDGARDVLHRRDLPGGEGLENSACSAAVHGRRGIHSLHPPYSGEERPLSILAGISARWQPLLASTYLLEADWTCIFLRLGGL